MIKFFELFTTDLVFNNYVNLDLKAFREERLFNDVVSVFEYDKKQKENVKKYLNKNKLLWNDLFIYKYLSPKDSKICFITFQKLKKTFKEREIIFLWEIFKIFESQYGYDDAIQKLSDVKEICFLEFLVLINVIGFLNNNNDLYRRLLKILDLKKNYKLLEKFPLIKENNIFHFFCLTESLGDPDKKNRILLSDQNALIILENIDLGDFNNDDIYVELLVKDKYIEFNNYDLDKIITEKLIRNVEGSKIKHSSLFEKIRTEVNNELRTMSSDNRVIEEISEDEIDPTVDDSKKSAPIYGTSQKKGGVRKQRMTKKRHKKRD